MISFIKSSQKKKLLAELEKNYGIKKVPYLLLETGKKKLRAFSGHLSKEEISQLADLINIEIIGMYLINKKDNDVRLNFDAVSLLRKQITKNIIKINKSQFEKWIRGYDLDIKTKRGIVVLSSNNELVGVGKSNTEKIFNYVPKERKLKTPFTSN
jgi:NOL1/NOP2/fmu family ribosome biogenesis protein